MGSNREKSLELTAHALRISIKFTHHQPEWSGRKERHILGMIEVSLTHIL